MPPALEHLFKSVPPWIILVFGAVMGSIRTVWDFLYEHTIGFLLNLISLSLTVEDIEHRDAYIWLSQWLEKNLQNRGINALLLRRSAGIGGYDPDAHDNQYTLIPHYGTYYMWWNKLPMMVSHWKEEQQQPGARKMHSIYIQIWFTRKRHLILDLLLQARDEYLATLPKSMDFYRWSAHDYDWVPVQLPLRSLESVYMPEGLVQDLLEDMRFFIDNKQMYIDLGTPRRRGYLFEGPPGTGKTTLIIALASELKLPVYAISLNQPDLTGDKLTDLLNNCAKPAIVIFEDADCLQMTRKRDEAEESVLGTTPNGLNLGDVLNALDGIGASEERLVFMTTNHPEKLDPALVRSGRIDRKFHIGYAADPELKRFYDRVAALRPLPSWEEFRERLPEETTIADAQALAFQGETALSRESVVEGYEEEVDEGEETDAVAAD